MATTLVNVPDVKIGMYTLYKGRIWRITSIEKPYGHITILGLNNRLFVRYMNDKSIIVQEEK